MPAAADALTLIILKQDLQLLHDEADEYLQTLIQAARANIAREGIAIDDNDPSHVVAVAQYAAWLYRKRTLDTAPMPRMLRWALNNILFQQKGGGDENA